VDKTAQLTALKAECLACRRCDIGGQMIGDKFLGNVFSNMNCTAEYMVVGQNPGKEETEREEPFVGISGKMFDQLVEEILGMKRSMFYISNTVHCYTPGNRKPTMGEVYNCKYFMDLEVRALNPKVVISLGGPAFEQLTGIHGIMKHHGNPAFSPRYKVPVFPLLHPSPINLNDPAKLELFVADLVKLEEFIKKGCVDSSEKEKK
jgi:uracil-DNA glycosylase family 4